MNTIHDPSWRNRKPAAVTRRPQPAAVTQPSPWMAYYRPTPVRPDYASLRTVALAALLLLAVPALHFALCLIP